jgi:tyrosyl-tRNA synthetase
MMKQGGISLDDEKIKDINHTITLESGQEVALKVGKRNFGIIKGK